MLNSPCPFLYQNNLSHFFTMGNGNKMLKITNITFPRVVTYLCPFHWLGQVGESRSWEEQAFLVSSPA